MKKEGIMNKPSGRAKYYSIALFVALVLIIAFYYFFFTFKTGDLVYKKNLNVIGEISGLSLLKLSYLVYWQDNTYSSEFGFNLEKVEQIRGGNFIEDKNLTPRYVPSNIPSNLNFSKSLFTELSREKIDDAEEVYGQIPEINKYRLCTPNLKCGAWSDCQVSYSLESLLNLDRIEGLEYKSCTDLNKCIPDITGSRICVSKVNITLSRGVWCGKEYTEVIDKNGKVLARLNTNNQTDYLDINFNLGSSYCYYCHDGKINYDETGLDCGGSCKACIKTKQKV